jgi:hypothetical protein
VPIKRSKRKGKAEEIRTEGIRLLAIGRLDILAA